MNLQIQIPERLKDILASRAAECGKDVESFVADSICEQLGSSIAKESDSATAFDLWLADVRSLVHKNLITVDDSRDSIYAGRDS
jgi:hypothetical protein